MRAYILFPSGSQYENGWYSGDSLESIGRRLFGRSQYIWVRKRHNPEDPYPYAYYRQMPKLGHSVLLASVRYVEDEDDKTKGRPKSSKASKPKTSRNGKDPEKVLFDAFYDKGCLMLDSNRTEGPDGVSYYPVVVGKEGGYRVYSVMPKGSGFDIPTCYAWYKNQRDANDMAYDLSTWWAKYGKAEPDGVWGGYRNGRSIEDDRPKGSASRKSTAKKTFKAVKPKASQPRRKNRQSAKKPKNSKGTKGVRS